MTQIYLNVNLNLNYWYANNEIYDESDDESDDDLCPCGGNKFRDLEYCALCIQSINCSICGEYLDEEITKCPVCDFCPIKDSCMKRKFDFLSSKENEPKWMKRYKLANKPIKFKLIKISPVCEMDQNI